MIEKIKSSLPSGSGFNCKWKEELKKNGNLHFSTHFHWMNENGYYDGFFPVRVIFKKGEKLGDFKYFGSIKKDPGFRDFSQDTIFYSLQENKMEELIWQG